MAMTCPQCAGSFDQRLHCPACGVRLVYQPAGAVAPARQGSGAWQHTPWGRILVGLLVSQGLSWGLQQLFLAGLLASGQDHGANVWATLWGLLLLQGLQVVGLIAGGALVGAGQRQGVIYGGIVGVWNGVIFILRQGGGNPDLFTPVTLYGQPILQTAFGAAGGFLGTLIWQPPPELKAPAPLRKPTPGKPVGGPAASPFNGPIAWLRVLVGSALAAGGALGADAALDLVIDTTRGKLTVTSHLQAHLVTFEITGLAILVGSAVAAATTANGLKQGLCVGVLTSTIVVGIRLGSGPANLDQLLFQMSSTLALSLVGGWFGAQLFPPVVPRSRMKQFGPGAQV